MEWGVVKVYLDPKHSQNNGQLEKTRQSRLFSLDIGKLIPWTIVRFGQCPLGKVHWRLKCQDAMLSMLFTQRTCLVSSKTASVQFHGPDQSFSFPLILVRVATYTSENIRPKYAMEPHVSPVSDVNVFLNNSQRLSHRSCTRKRMDYASYFRFCVSLGQGPPDG